MDNSKKSSTYGFSFDVSRFNRIHVFNMTSEQFNELLTANPQFEPIENCSHEGLSNIFIAGSN